MTQLELLVEDRSGGLYLEALVHSLIRNWGLMETVQIRLRPHKGLGGFQFDWSQPPKPQTGTLLKLLPAKLRAYSRLGLQDPLVLVVVFDADQHAVENLLNPVLKMVHRYANPIPVVIGIAVEELEAWALADWQAIQTAYPEADLNLYQAYQQDSICGTWETLAQILLPEAQAKRLIRLGYPAVGQSKYEWARAISPHLEAARNRSPSFQILADKLSKILVSRGADS